MLQTQTLLELSTKVLKVGQNRGFDPPLRQLSNKSSLANTRAYFESWVKLLEISFSTSHTSREFYRFKIGCVHGIHYP